MALNTTAAVILRDAIPPARDTLGRGEVLTLKTRGQDEVTPRVISFSTLTGQYETEPEGAKGRQRVKISYEAPSDTMVDPRKWVYATWRGREWRVTSPPVHVTDAVVIIEIESMARQERTARTYDRVEQ